MRQFRVERIRLAWARARSQRGTLRRRRRPGAFLQDAVKKAGAMRRRRQRDGDGCDYRWMSHWHAPPPLALQEGATCAIPAIAVGEQELADFRAGGIGYAMHVARVHVAPHRDEIPGHVQVPSLDGGGEVPVRNPAAMGHQSRKRQDLAVYGAPVGGAVVNRDLGIVEQEGDDRIARDLDGAVKDRGAVPVNRPRVRAIADKAPDDWKRPCLTT